MMENNDANECLNAFSKLCDELDSNELVGAEECQYWVFERGYQAAMQEVAKVIQLRKSDRATDLKLDMTINRAAYH